MARSASKGVALAILSSAAFGTSGSFATSLIDAGWTPGAAVLFRVGVAALLLSLPALLHLRRAGLAPLKRSATIVSLYGVVAVAGSQFCYFNALQHLPVGVALLLEYLGIVLVVLWQWARHAEKPRWMTIAGSAVALIGLLFVLEVNGAHHPDFTGVLWGLGAALGLAFYYVLSAHAEEALPPLVMTWASMAVGATTLLALGALGAMPLYAVFGEVAFAGHRTTWLLPALGLAAIGAVIAYISGIDAARLLGARLASFVGLTEVLFAVLFAWLFLDQMPGPMQLLGGAFIIGGIALVRLDELQGERASKLAACPMQ